MIYTVSHKNLPIASLITVHQLTNEHVDVQYTNEATLIFDGISFSSDVSVCRYLARLFPSYKLYGSSPLQYLEVDHWLSFCLGRLISKNLEESLVYLNHELSNVTYLVGSTLTIADIFVWSTIAKNPEWNKTSKQEKYSNIVRWFDFVRSHSCVEKCLKLGSVISSMASSKKEKEIKKECSDDRKEEGKFIELPGAEQGKVVVRFPPEASGYLHIGHAKAALLNQYYKDKFDGTLIMRFDDTNPAKEKVDFEKVILEDLEMLQIKPDKFTHTSDYFDLMLDLCEKLIKDGKAYVDDTDPETMKVERDKKAESKHRTNSVIENLKMWQEMLKGTEYGTKCCVRAKIDMNSPNGCLRDPTIYRCKPETHPKTGNKYKVYPTYDFACPIVDSIEGVTHCLRTTEYHDRDDQFYWFIDALGLRKPYIWSYSRLNMTNTVLSKRKLTWFVEEGYVDGWDDPRFPTVRGILRRGMTVAGLKQFIVAQGSSRSVVVMEWDKIWAFNKKVIDPVAPRYVALEATGTIPVLVEGVKTEKVRAPKHPKNSEVGEKWVWRSNKILIDHIDAEALKENENTTFVNWGNLMIKKINRIGNNITSIEAQENLSNTDYKKTLKLTWLSALPEEAPFVPCVCVYFDHLISKAVLAKEEDFKQFINPNTRIEVKMQGDPELINVKKGDIIQLQRRGFYICDQEYKPPSIYTSNGSPLVLFFIPDGHSKETAIIAHSKKDVSNENAVKCERENTKKTGSSCDEKKNSQVSKQLQAPGSVVLEEAIKLLESIKDQGDKIRKLKADKCDKKLIDQEVQVLLKLKNSFKVVTNIDWKPDVTIEKLKSTLAASSSCLSQDCVKVLHEKVCVQASRVRCMQNEKADKNLINTELTILADLKEKYKSEVGEEWSCEGINLDSFYDKFTKDLYDKVTSQGDKVRQLKSQKANKAVIDQEVKILLQLKSDYKEVAKVEYKPAETKAVEQKSINNGMSNNAQEINEKIVEQGNKVRELKSTKSSKEAIDSAVKVLLQLKEEFKKATGTDWTPPKGPNDSTGVKKGSQKKEKVEKPKAVPQKGQTRLGLEVKKEENLAEWYSQIITKSELIEYYDVSGCYTLRPWAFAIWKVIRSWFDEQITNLGVDECYFPMFVSKHALEREKTHIADFAPEVAWVTKSGDSDLEEPIAIRPTSETVMYPAYAKWIRSHRDLPLKLNQWNNVVRWEFKHPQPFLRTREFLWQEGHSAFASQKEAEEEVYIILDLYRRVYTDLLAIPVVKGRKTEKEKFAGGDFTTTVEAFISASGRAIQGATSHHLGQNFSKMFEITFEDPETQEKKHVYQNSWGLTTRTVGVLIMVHADDQGLVLPPKVAKIQVVIVPCGITANLGAADRQRLDESCSNLENLLNSASVRVTYDSRDNYSSGWKFNHWELKGVPIRIELGPKDMKENQVVVVRRDTSEKVTLKNDNVINDIKNLLENIQQSMYKKAENDLKTHTVKCDSWKDFTTKLNQKNIILSPFCGEIPCEDLIKKDSAGNEGLDPNAPSMGAKSLCIPFDQPAEVTSNTRCIHPDCKKPAKFYTLFGRSY